jgi:hypothetical protein
MTLVSLAEPKNSIKVKGNLPGWEDFKKDKKPEIEKSKPEAEYDPRLVRAAIKSDYDKGRKPKRKAFEALGHVSFIDSSAPKQAPTDAGGIEEVDASDLMEDEEELEELDIENAETTDELELKDLAGAETTEELGLSDLARAEGTERLKAHDIEELDQEGSKPGQIVVEGKRRHLVVEGQETRVAEVKLPSFSPPKPTGMQADPPVPKAPPPQPVSLPGPAQPPVAFQPFVPAARQPTPPPQAAPVPRQPTPPPQVLPIPRQPASPPQAVSVPKQPTQPPARPSRPVDEFLFAPSVPPVKGLAESSQARAPKTTVPMQTNKPEPPGKATVPLSMMPAEAPYAAASRQDLAGRPTSAAVQPAQQDQHQYDPETLRKIMQQAQAAAMMRMGKSGPETARISLPLAVLLITMGTLSILGLAVIIFLLISM